MAPSTPAEVQFNTSSKFKLPDGFDKTRAWKIQNKYPLSSSPHTPEYKPWLDVDFKDPDGAREYCDLLRDYFFRGNTEHNFIVQDNHVRSWYHAPWLHYGDKGREPINGLNFGGFLPPQYLAKEQGRYLQAWLCSYFNWEAATVLGDMWADPDNPKWDDHLHFPVGSVICENIWCDLNDEDFRLAKGSPAADACIGELPKYPDDAKAPLRPGGEGISTRLRLVQVDFATRDPRSPTGWVFGTYACDGRLPIHNPWDKVFPIGLQYGNSPDVLQKEYDAGARPTELWINPDAIALLKELGGKVGKGNRPWFGWHDRLDGLADDFMGTCTSCHATAQLSPDPTSRVQVPNPTLDDKTGRWVQKDEETEKKWFRNLPSGTPFDEGALSADYNIHVELGFRNYREWRWFGGGK